MSTTFLKQSQDFNCAKCPHSPARLSLCSFVSSPAQHKKHILKDTAHTYQSSMVVSLQLWAAQALLAPQVLLGEQYAEQVLQVLVAEREQVLLT